MCCGDATAMDAILEALLGAVEWGFIGLDMFHLVIITSMQKSNEDKATLREAHHGVGKDIVSVLYIYIKSVLCLLSGFIPFKVVSSNLRWYHLT